MKTEFIDGININTPAGEKRLAQIKAMKKLRGSGKNENFVKKLESKKRDLEK